jgi:hypothetical protein
VASVQQVSVPVTPGQAYTLSFRYRLVSNNGPCALFVVINADQSNNVEFSSNSPTNGAWASFSSTWTAPTAPTASFPDTTKAEITIILYTDVATTVWISDVSFDACVELN